jgi:hypothetical protein
MWGIDTILAFNTDSTERMRIDSSGNVGIGTSGPAVKLDVNGAIRNASGNAGGAHFWSYTTTNVASRTWAIYNDYTVFGDFAILQSSSQTGNPTTSRMYFDASGNVGIGTGSPSYPLEVRQDGASSFNYIGSLNTTATGAFGAGFLARAGSGFSYFYMRGDGLAYVENATNNPLGFSTNGSEKMRITGAGNVGIGTTNPSVQFVVSNAGAEGYEVNSTGGAGGGATISTYNRTSGLYTTRTTYSSAHTWFVSTAGSTRAMDLNSSGDLLVSKSAVNDTDVGVLLAGAATGQKGAITSTLASSTSGAQTMKVYSTGAGAYRFYVDMAGTVFATSTTISAISDIRLKENVRELDAGLDTILALKPRRFDWKQGKGKDVRDDIGFIAQEVEEVLPELIGGWKAGEGEPDDLKSVKAGDLIPVLVKAIQELTARVAQLEERK